MSNMKWFAVAAVVTAQGSVPALAQDGAVQLDEILVAGTATKAGPTNGPTGVKGYTAEAVSGATKTSTPLVKIPQTISVVHPARTSTIATSRP